MKKETKLRVARIMTPFAIGILKVHTALTGVQRARVMVVNEQGKLLLVRGMIGPKWSLPGGAIEKGETPMEAALRELHEETGIAIDTEDIQSVGILQGAASPVNYVAHLFYVSVVSQALPAVQYNTQEIIELDWFAVDSLPADTSTIVEPCMTFLPKSL